MQTVHKPSKKDKKFEEMVQECVKNSEARLKDPKEHEAWRQRYAKMLRTGQKEVTYKSSGTIGNCFKKQIDDTKWNNEYKDNEELKAREAAAQKEVDSKRKRLSPQYNKGPVQYITDLKDLTTLGRKI